MQREHIPDVSVIIAVYNAMPYLVECLDSVVNQSIGVERIEVIAVDDGSTDGSGAELDRYAARHPQMRVVHQANSGGASAPRNRALDLARGRYVYVVDADDYLGPEALARLVGMADSQDGDVVLGRQVGLGRAVSDKAYRHAESADLYTSGVYRSLRSFKLIRRAVLEYNRIRYPEDLWYGEDQVFMTAVYLAARKISVVGDYDCYFLRKREDGGNITSRPRTAWENVESIDRAMRMVSDAVGDPVGRRRMLGRHFRSLLQRMTAAARTRAGRPDYAAEVLWRSKAMCEAYWTPDMYGELSHVDRIRMYCFLYGAMEAFEQLAAYDPKEAPPGQIVDNGRVYRLFPLFRDPAVGLPDALFEITDTLKVVHRLDSLAWTKGNRMRVTGRGYITSLGAGRMGTELALRQRETGVEYLVPVTACPWTDAAGDPTGPTGFEVETDPASVDGAPLLSGFEAEVDFASMDGGPILPGTWDLFLNVRTDGVMRPARLGRHAAPGLDRTARRPRVVHQDPASGTELAATVFFTAGYDNLSIEVTRRLPLPAAVAAQAG
ncbi:glycosyltransferase family 2 protein [Streptomyces sp. NPDC060048]|uniref:glycosyltransferase family 2 protein n=1 Tax=unclassified Streptomyces TaxID=2593676 RepID=UPI003687D5CA